MEEDLPREQDQDWLRNLTLLQDELPNLQVLPLSFFLPQLPPRPQWTVVDSRSELPSCTPKPEVSLPLRLGPLESDYKRK